MDLKYLLNNYLGYKNAIDKEKLKIRDECYEELVQAVFYGEHLEQHAICHLLEPQLWEIWRTLEFSRVVMNDNTEILAKVMASSFVYSNTIFEPSRLMAGSFLRIFGDSESGHILRNYLMDGTIGTNAGSFKFVEALFDHEGDSTRKRPVIAPLNEEALINIPNEIMSAGKSLGEYGFSFRHLRKRPDFYEIIQRWWESLSSSSTLRTIQKAMCAELGKMEYYMELLESSAGDNAYRLELLLRLSRMKKTPPIRLGKAVNLPTTLIGVDLCNILRYWCFSINTMADITGLPSEDDFKVRTIELLISQNRELYERGLADRDLIELGLRRRE